MPRPAPAVAEAALMPVQEAAVDRARRWSRQVIRQVRCDNRPVARYGFNLSPVLQHRRRPRPLSEVARAVAETLRADGIAMVDAAALLGGSGPLERAADYAERLIREQEREVGHRRGLIAAGIPDRVMKPYLVELMGVRPRLDPDDPVLQVALQDQVRGVAEAYSRCRLRVHDVNVWLNLASPLAPTASQRWHRDLPEDYDIVKCFLYLRPVSAGAGAMEYARFTHSRAGRRISIPRHWDGIGWRVEDSDVERRIPAGHIVRATGPRGTLVFADTRGLHKGGLARDTDRLIAQVLFASAACCRPRLLRPAPGHTAAEFPGVRLAHR